MFTSFDPAMESYEEPGSYLRPSYDGLGIANVLPTVFRHFGLDNPTAPLSEQALPAALLEGVDCVVTLLVDALGSLQMDHAAASGSLPLLSNLIGSGRAWATRLTSTFPSTTATALTTLGSGLTPGRHGVVSQVFFDSRLGTTVDVLRFQPRVAGRPLASAGVDPAKWMGAPSVYESLEARGVSTAVVNHAELETTALSIINHRGAQYVGFTSLSDLCVNLTEVVETIERPAYLHAYWSKLDNVSHVYGVSAPQQRAEIQLLDYAISRLLLGNLSKPRTLVLIFADHGHIDTSPDHTVVLDEHPDLLECLQIPPSGIPRARLLHIKPGRLGEVREYLADAFGNKAFVLDTEESVALGLYDVAKPSDRALERLGQLLLVPKDNWLSQYRGPENEAHKGIIGRHGGMSPSEMLVPLIAFRT